MSDADASWNWQGCEGKPVIVEVFSPGEEVELFINGASLGRKKAGKDAGYRVLYECTYNPGWVEAVTYDDWGAEIGKIRITTAIGEKQLVLRKESGEEKELLFIEIQICDSKGHVFTDCDCELTLKELEGAEVLGFGSGNPKPDHNFNEGMTRTWLGRAQMILKKRGNSDGKVNIIGENGLEGVLKF